MGKSEVSPKVMIVVVLVALLAVAAGAAWMWRAPSITPAEGVGGPPSHPMMSGGGPTAEDLKKRDEYYRQHPESSPGR